MVVSFIQLDHGIKTGWWGGYLCDSSEKSTVGRGTLARRVEKTTLEYAFNEMWLDLLLFEVQ